MEIKQVKCASCGVILSVKNSKNEAEKLITCPQCKAQLKVRFHHPQAQQSPLEAHTFIAQRRPTADGETRIAGADNSGATQLAGKPRREVRALLILGYHSYPLSIGQNVVGRKAPTSAATVQLATDDRYMSRQHALVNLVQLADGRLKALLSNYQNKNTTAVNGEPLANGDEIVLTDGDKLQMGHTEITYKEQQS